MRSKLFVPGSRSELFAKALAGQADAISIDLEDAVPQSRKAEARSAVAAFLQSPAALATSKALIVRVNALDTGHFREDVAAICLPALALLNIPKAESLGDVDAAVDAIDSLAASSVRGVLHILANIETPKGLRNAAAMAAHPRVAGLQLGYADLFGPHALERRDHRNLHAAMFSVRMAAAESGKFVCDGAFPDVNDPEGFRAEAQLARAVGLRGKSCIHPSQIPIANEVFAPSDAEVAQAQRILEVASRAEAGGAGAFLLDGRMMDAPDVKQAREIVAAAKATKSKL